MRMKETTILFSYLAAVGAILGAVFFFSVGEAKSAEIGDTGFINENTHRCESDSITPYSVGTFEKYKYLINKVEAVGIENLTDTEITLGEFLTNMDWCGTVAQDYRVVLSFVKGNYVLFFFDEGYDFGTEYITLLESFHADELL